MSNMKDSSIVKIAVEMEGQASLLIEFNQKQPLTAIIQELCNGWGLSDPEQYGMQFSETNNNNYITEKNRNEIKNGSFLRLTFSPAKTAADILLCLNVGSPEDKIQLSLEKLSKLSSDITFAMEFIKKQGLSLIIQNVEKGKFKGMPLAYCLKSFLELMDHGNVSWDILESSFITTIANYVNIIGSVQEGNVIKAALSILENIVVNSSGKYPQVEREVTFQTLVLHIQNRDPIIQLNAVSLINALFAKAEASKKKEIAEILNSKPVRSDITTYIIKTASEKEDIGAEMAHQLYVLQTLVFNLLEQRMNAKMDPQDQDAQDRIKELRKIAFDGDNSSAIDSVTRRHIGSHSKDYKKLGFKCDINPSLDFAETPPGMLALDFMIYFARNHTESYTKVVLENSCRQDEHECPFGRVSVELSKLLCEVLRVGESPSEQCSTYHPALFTHPQPLHELFSICIVLLNKTWKEMRATIEDFVKVMSVVREQITRSLLPQPVTLDLFKKNLSKLTYQEITNLWQQERTSREEWESQARPIVELKESITPEILTLVTQQRLGFLVEGTRFTKYSPRGQRIKDKYWYVVLSPSHKVLHYGDCDEKSIPLLDSLPSKLAVIDIRALVTGKDCPHMKDVRGRKTAHHLAFSLTLDSVEMTSLDFVAPDKKTFDYWTDGINALLGNKMISEETDNDLQMLLSIEIKLRLLDAEGIDIPQQPPPVPDDPPNYDFCFP